MILIRPQARLKIGAVTVLKEVWFPLVLGPSSPALLTLGRFQVSSMGKGDDGGGGMGLVLWAECSYIRSSCRTKKMCHGLWGAGRVPSQEEEAPLTFRCSGVV